MVAVGGFVVVVALVAFMIVQARGGSQTVTDGTDLAARSEVETSPHQTPAATPAETSASTQTQSNPQTATKKSSQATSRSNSNPKPLAPTPSPNPEPTPSPEPTPPAFAVTLGTGHVSPTALFNGTSASFVFPVTANAPGSVSWIIVASVNGNEYPLASSSMVFTGAGTQDVTLNLLSLSGSPWDTATTSSSNWAQLRVSSPNVITSNQAPFTFISLYEA